MQPSRFRISRPLLGLAALVLTLAWLGSAAFAADFVSTQPAARVEHWQRREAEINAYIRDSKDLKSVKLLFVGDSITDFWLFDDNPWVSGQKYGRPVWDESFGKPNSENFGLNIGISGDRIEHVLYRILPKASGGLGQLDSPDLNPEFIVALIGINNTWAAEKPVTDSVFEGVRAVLTALHERKPKARIILQTLLPTNDEAKNRDVVRPVNQRLRQLVASAPFAGFISLLDLYPAFVDGSGAQVSAYFTDGLHPNVKGYRVWRDRLVPFLQQARSLAPSSTPGQTAPLGSPTQPTVSVGRIERLDHFPSRFVQARPIDVWLPSDYSPQKRYAVLYMHDGQGLFDAELTWNKQAWNVHLALSRLMQDGKVQDTIVVGIPNGGRHRYSEYYPDKYLALAPPDVRADYVHRAQADKPLADAYLRFIVEELKPAIDQRYATLREPAGTFIMGSSMGGMVSIYALCEYPQVFGGAAALSTHWVGRPSSWGTPDRLQNASLPSAAFKYLQGHLPKANTRRLYMDHGTTGLDAIYGIHQARVDEIGREMGYDAAHWQSRIFAGAGHTEADWSARVEIPLAFLLAKP